MIDSPALHAAVCAIGAFRDLSRADVSFLIEASEIRSFEPDEIMLSQGEPSECAIVLLEGEVTVTADSARGVIPIATMKAPSLVGDLGALADLRRTATVRARTNVSALIVPRTALIKVARAAPSLLIDVIGR
ncbi:MAG TPA: cyclic nucleotide-binding domain-containing protein, partial [Roseiarcus sp.]|nr:cyclic nucleotide-binding domain-containing protein [Roseiarcus sp.]